MSDQSCAHMTITYVTEPIGAHGHVRGRWRCRDCGMNFVPQSAQEPILTTYTPSPFYESSDAITARNAIPPADPVSTVYLHPETANDFRKWGREDLTPAEKEGVINTGINDMVQARFNEDGDRVEATLADTRSPNQRKALEDFYAETEADTIGEKISALRARLGPTELFSKGGSFTPYEELSALEDGYLAVNYIDCEERHDAPKPCPHCDNGILPGDRYSKETNERIGPVFCGHCSGTGKVNVSPMVEGKLMVDCPECSRPKPKMIGGRELMQKLAPEMMSDPDECKKRTCRSAPPHSCGNEKDCPECRRLQSEIDDLKRRINDPL